MSLLNDRERAVALAVAEGLSNTEIGKQLFVSASSIKASISSALAKLDLTNRIQLAILAYESHRGATDPKAVDPSARPSRAAKANPAAGTLAGPADP